MPLTVAELLEHFPHLDVISHGEGALHASVIGLCIDPRYNNIMDIVPMLWPPKYLSCPLDQVGEVLQTVLALGLTVQAPDHTEYEQLVSQLDQGDP